MKTPQQQKRDEDWSELGGQVVGGEPPVSTTPRTDAEQDDARNVALHFTCRNPPPKDGENLYVVPADFARQLERALNALKSAIAEHHNQKADDRCIEDDDRIYAAVGLPPCDRRVGSKEQMLANCARFIERRCEAGGWKSYQELERERDQWRKMAEDLAALIDTCKGHGTPIIKDRADCYVALNEFDKLTNG